MKRSDDEHGAGTIKGVARKFGVHQRMVREALGCATPVERKRPERDSPSLGTVKGFIDQILEADRKAPRKQRHTAHRVWVRIGKEQPECHFGESTVRRYCAGEEATTGAVARRDLHSADIRLGSGGAGGLV